MPCLISTRSFILLQSCRVHSHILTAVRLFIHCTIWVAWEGVFNDYCQTCCRLMRLRMRPTLVCC